MEKLNYSANTVPIIVTGGAGFIGFHLCRSLLEKGVNVTAIDNLNPYYDVSLKKERLSILKRYCHFSFIQMDLSDKENLKELFISNTPQIVVNLAAQAGVRYSIDNPDSYIQSNIVGFFNILECCRHYPVKHLLYASSSSVYGANTKIPYSTSDKTETPVSLYAATKKADELMAYSYSKLYGIPSTGLRFFTVYGPMGRPDMAYFSFTEKILNHETIKIFNQGNMYRDFTYIDDIVQGLETIMERPPVKDETGALHKIYNIGNNKPEKLLDFISILEECLGLKANKEFLPMQPGDVYQTYADIHELIRDFQFKPQTPLRLGLTKFVNWYREYYRV